MSQTYAEHLNRLAAVWGADRVGEALDFALEGGRLALTSEQLIPLVRAWAWLGILGMQPTSTAQGFYAWSREHHLVSDEQWEEARKLDLLAMKPDHPCPVRSPVDGSECIRELHHSNRHVDETGWVW